MGAAADAAVDDPFALLTRTERALLRKVLPPGGAEPMLATLTDRRFSDPAWMYEHKFDGIRCLAFRHGSEVRLLSRNGERLDGRFPEVADEIGAQRSVDFVIDGEVVAFKGRRTSFELLQQRSGRTDARKSEINLRYYVFDILYFEGNDTRALPLRARKQLLRSAIGYDGPLKFTTHRKGDGERYFEQACRWGWEGLVAKRADSPYVPRRSPDWLKFKCGHGQEFVIGGFTEPRGSRIGFGAILVGYFRDDGSFHYAGKVGTGFSHATLVDVRERMDSLEVTGSPFVGARRFERGTHFVRPDLVVQVGFAEWTRDGLLRQPRFQEMREDKPALDVRRETPTGS